MSNKKQGKIRKIGDALELPGGLLEGGPHIEMRSNREAVIDGRCTVLEYEDCLIRINTGKGIIRFCGRGLQIKNLSSDGMIIEGFICSLDFTD